MSKISRTMTIPENVEQEIIKGLKKFEEKEKFRNPNLTAAMLAVSLNTNTTYLTIAIKKNKGANFNSYINELRINYICQKIKKYPNYCNYKMSYLAEDCGFISHSSFSTIFKKVTGIPPSEFLAAVEKNTTTDIKIL